MALTYESLATTTLSSSATTITFGGISSSYTDLKLVLTFLVTSTGSMTHLRFNSDDNNANYESINSYGSGGSTYAGYSSTQRIIMDGGYDSLTIPTLSIVDIFSYTNSFHKSVLVSTGADKAGSGAVQVGVGRYISTSVISSIDIKNTNGFASGTIATLYGIKRA